MAKVTKLDDIEDLREGGKLLASVLSNVATLLKEGATGDELDELAERLMREGGGKPAFKWYQADKLQDPYPATLCVSVNHEVVHGIPYGKVFKNGDVVSLDTGVIFKGFYTDAAITVIVGKAKEVKINKLIDVCLESLAKGVAVIRPGAHIGDIGAAIQSYVEGQGFAVVRSLVGHGVGKAVHEEPEIPNFGKAGTGPLIEEGQVLAIEPMITAGKPAVSMDDDLWTWRTSDKSIAAHFEHTVLVTKDGCEILTTRS